MKIVEIVSRDPNHANRLFDVNGVEYSHSLTLDTPELPFSGLVWVERKMVVAFCDDEFAECRWKFSDISDVSELVLL